MPRVGLEPADAKGVVGGMLWVGLKPADAKGVVGGSGCRGWDWNQRMPRVGLESACDTGGNGKCLLDIRGLEASKRYWQDPV